MPCQARRFSAAWPWDVAVAGEGPGLRPLWSLEFIVPLKQVEYGVYGDLIIIRPKPYSIYLKGVYRVPSLGLMVSLNSKL